MNFELDLVLNNKTFSFRGSDIWKLESELSDAFRNSAINKKLETSLKIVIYSRLATKNSNF